MDHIVYLDHKAAELKNLRTGAKTMIIRGAMGRKLPYGRVMVNDRLFFTENNGEGLISAQGLVQKVEETPALDREASLHKVEQFKAELMLDARLMKRFAGKRYLIFITVSDVKDLDPFRFDRSRFKNMDDWLPVDDITSIKL